VILNGRQRVAPSGVASRPKKADARAKGTGVGGKEARGPGRGGEGGAGGMELKRWREDRDRGLGARTAGAKESVGFDGVS